MEAYKYLAIVEWAKDYIQKNNIPSGSRFLSENELCAIHNVSRQTVRQALMMLENQNVIVRMRGSGTFVKNGIEASAKQPGANIALITTYFSDYIFPSIVTGIESTLKKNNAVMQLSITQNQVFEESRALMDMVSHGVQGFIVEPSKSALPNPNMKLYEDIRSRNIPLVFFNAKYPWSDAPCIALDDVLAGRLVTDFLFEAGHKKVCGIFSLDDIQGHKRYQGFVESCIKNRITNSEQNVLWYSSNEWSSLFTLSGERIIRLLSSSTGVVCYNDKLAVDLINFCKSHGIAVPDDISVVGIDDSKLATLCDVKLTTVRHPHQLLGEAAAEMLLRMMNNPGQKYEDVIFEPKLIVRDSVKTLR